MKTKSVFKLSLITTLILTLNAKEYTIDELITSSLKNSPDIKIASANYEASTKRYDTAFASYLPKVDLSALGGINSQDGGVIQNGPVSDEILRGNLSVQQLVYDFQKTSGGVNSAKYQSDAFEMENKQKISNKIKEVKTAYYNVLKAKSLIEVLQENVKLNEAQLYRAQKYFQAGIRTKIDISDAQVALIKSKISLNKANYDLESKYAALDKALGITKTDRDYQLAFTTLDINNLTNELKEYDLSLKDCVEYAYTNKPEVASYRYQIEASKSDINTINGEYFPSIYLYGDYTKQKINKLTQNLPQDSWQATVNLNWNLYQGGATNSKKEEKIINSNIAQYNLVFAQLQIKQNVTNSYINLSQKKDEVELSDSLVIVSNQKFDQASKRYENGLADYIELQQARQEYIDAKANLVNSFFDYYIAIAQLDNAIGK